MSNIAVRAKNLSKRYRIGELHHGYKTIREKIIDAGWNPFQRLNNSHKTNSSDEATIWALRNVSFEVNAGEVLGIIGRNGAGKSTLLKILSRITVPTEGRVELFGRIGSLLEVGTGFHQELSGRENIFLNGAIIGMKQNEIKRKFDEIVAFAEIEKFLDTPVKRYSSGMYVRLAFAVAAHLDPEILVVDEVLAVGDAAFQKKCLGKMGDVARGGRTVLFVSHNMGVMNRLCERGVWLDNGQIIKMGSMSEVVQSYLSSSATTTGIWTNTQPYIVEPDIKILSASVTSVAGIKTALVRFDEDFGFEIDLEIQKPILSWFLLLRITDSTGNPVFTSWDIDSASHKEVTEPGHYRAFCHVPGKLLRPGVYSVTLLARIPQVKTLDNHDNAFHFEISGVGYTMNTYRMGVITPVLDWTVEQLGVSSS